MCEATSFKLWLLQIVALLGLIALILWLTMRPKVPTYTIVDLSLPLSNTSMVDDAGQNGTLSYSLEIQNSNKDSSVYYDDILLSFYYNQDTIGEKKIPSFHQGKDKTIQIRDHVNGNARAWNALLKAVANKTAEVNVNLETKIRYRMFGHTGKHHGINLNGRVPIGSDGKISGKKKKVKLHSISKKWRLRAA